MAYEQRENSGSIFKNDDKKSDNHPDATGSALIGGVEYWISGWWKASEGKKPFFSLSFTPKNEQQTESRDTSPEPPPMTANPFG